MKRIAFSFVAASALLLAAGCNKNTSMDSQHPNTATEQSSPAMNNTPPAGAAMTNAAPSAGMNTNSAGMETNAPAVTNQMNTTTNMAPP